MYLLIEGSKDSYERSIVISIVGKYNTLEEASEELKTICYDYYWTFEEEEFKKHTNKKVVYQYDLNSNFIQSFDGARQAARQLGFKDATGIIKNCNKKQKTCNGFIFKYEMEEDN